MRIVILMTFVRKQLPHRTPDWVRDGEIFFITICLKERHSEQLIQPEVAKGILASAKYYQDSEQWWIQLLTLMPNYLHGLISFNQRIRPMSETVRHWKRYLQRDCNIEWQRNYFDHRLRSAYGAREKAIYIRENPVRAGLVQSAEEWPYTWTAETLGSGGRPDRHALL